jgi:hypothetical protein
MHSCEQDIVPDGTQGINQLQVKTLLTDYYQHTFGCKCQCNKLVSRVDSDLNREK